MAVKVQGLEEIVNRLKALPAEIAGKNGGPLRVALAKAARVIRDDARGRAPFNAEGIGDHLRDNIIIVRDRDPRSIGAAEHYEVTVRYKGKKYKNNKKNKRKGLVGKTYQNFGDFYYWRFLEFGTSKMAARPFLRPAFEAQKSSLTELFKTELSAAVAAAVKRLANQ